MKHLVIFHYHLLPGGVTNVINLSVNALISCSKSLESITIVSGRSENCESVLKKIDKNSKVRITLDILPEIDYINNERSADDIKIKSLLLQKYAGKVWLVHNYHLGKNPFFTKALLEITEKNPDQKIIFYIHDFPESSRYANLKQLNSTIHTPFYPIKNNVRYVVINSRDKNLLISAGLPEKMVFLVNNPVKSSNEKVVSDISLQEKLTYFNNKGFGNFDPELKTALYPVRTIRRKNVIESMLLTQLSKEKFNLLVTLPGVSTSEKPYSDLVQKIYKEELVNGLCSFGEHLHECSLPFENLLTQCDMVISSSIQEGFGYLFIDSIQKNRPLFARYLDIIEGFIDIFPKTGVHFYNSIIVPLNKNQLKSVKEMYTKKIAELKSILSEEAVHYLAKQVSNLVSQTHVDFSYISKEMQYDILKHVNNSELLRSEVMDINRELLESLDSTIHSTIPDLNTNTKFSYKTYADSIQTVFASFKTDLVLSKNNEKNNITMNLIYNFASLDYLRLLYN